MDNIFFSILQKKAKMALLVFISHLKGQLQKMFKYLFAKNMNFVKPMTWFGQHLFRACFSHA